MEKDRIPYPTTVNDPMIYELARGVGETLLGREKVIAAAPVMAAEDFGFYAQKIPGTLFWLGILNQTSGSVHPLHSPFFFMDESALSIGAAFHAAVAMTYLDSL